MSEPTVSTALTYDNLKAAVSGSAAAFRCRSRLQPAGGEGDKVFPPTYTGAVYAKEERRVPKGDGSFETIPCVLLDSVQSQANRLEDALQRAVDSGQITGAGCSLPVIEVDFSGEALLDQVGRISSLEAPHRAADAILRDSLIAEGEEQGKAFRKSSLGEKLDHASLANATPLYEICPTALVFGIWDSTGPKGGLGAKFQRAVVSEIVGINASFGVKTSSRIDPLAIRKQSGPIYRAKDTTTAEWTVNAEEAEIKSGKAVPFQRSNKENKESGTPASVNHGNIPPDVDGKTGGVTIDYAELTTVVSLPALRRLRFPLNNQPPVQAVNTAGQTVLAALSLAATALAAESGYDLRSRCLLWPSEPLEWELLDVPGQPPKRFRLTSAEALSLLAAALEDAEAAGLVWRKDPLKLKPSEQLVALLKKSQELAAATGDGEE